MMGDDPTDNMIRAALDVMYPPHVQEEMGGSELAKDGRLWEWMRRVLRAALRVGPSPQPDGETDAVLMAIRAWRDTCGGDAPPVVYGIVRRAYEMGSVRVPPSEPSEEAAQAFDNVIDGYGHGIPFENDPCRTACGLRCPVWGRPVWWGPPEQGGIG